MSDQRLAEDILKKKIAIIIYEEVSNDWNDEAVGVLIKQKPANTRKFEFKVKFHD